MSTIRLQLIASHSTFLTVLIEKDNQSLQPENTFSWKRFHTQLQKYLLSHRYSNQLRTAFRTRARLVCHLVFNAMRSISISVVRREFFFFFFFTFSTYASKVVILCRDELHNGTSEIVRSNARWKYRDWTCTFCFPIFRGSLRSYTGRSKKRRFSMYFVLLNFRDN